MTTATLPLPALTLDVASETFRATSASHPGITHTVAIHAGPAYQLRTTCTCPAGRHARPGSRPIPCRHARAVAVYLEQLGDAEREGAGYTLTLDITHLWADLATAAEPVILSPLERLAVAASAAGYDLDTVLTSAADAIALLAS